MCMKKKNKPQNPQAKANSVRVTATQPKVDSSKKKISSAPAKGPDQPAPSSESRQEEKTCISDHSDLMQISAYKTAKKKGGGSDSGLIVAKPVDRDQDSPEVFENNAQIESLNPINVTQIFMDSVIPQTNVSKQHTDVVDQNTLEAVDAFVEDMIFDPLEPGEEQNPEEPQRRPKANVLQPEDETIAETMSGRHARHSEKRMRPSAARTEHRPPTTPDRLPSVFTPQPPTKSEKGLATCKRAPSRGAVSTRTTTVSRQRPLIDYSHEPLLTQGTIRVKKPSTEHRTVVQTAVPIEPKDNACQRWEIRPNEPPY
ncbi:hypothetical protein PMAYCL1PPCAC_23158 [Pristionchus mayeri]|uniref:Uncharacterized protein n=1 Tax=Pristionchus mayeri TaxID=1317129 RepID=A0AAN5I5F5_9BILA|nr:hypothetical protein PMAYCL1PPCAC_23158 [Pristionchus mayeri]